MNPVTRTRFSKSNTVSESN